MSEEMIIFAHGYILVWQLKDNYKEQTLANRGSLDFYKTSKMFSGHL